MGRWGFFITFEGAEGSGKSSLAEGLSEKLRDMNLPVVFTREPGATIVGEKIREILLSREIEMEPYSELFLFLAARSENTKKIILPALQKGNIVISDRYELSSFAYQGFGRGIPLKVVSRLNKVATSGIRPSLTFLVDIPLTIGFNRKSLLRDRIEKEENSFHQRVREGFLVLAHKAKKRIKILDGTKPIEENVQLSLEITLKRLKEKKKIKV